MEQLNGLRAVKEKQPATESLAEGPAKTSGKTRLSTALSSLNVQDGASEVIVAN